MNKKSHITRKFKNDSWQCCDDDGIVRRGKRETGWRGFLVVMEDDFRRDDDDDQKNEMAAYEFCEDE